MASFPGVMTGAIRDARTGTPGIDGGVEWFTAPQVS
jgi:hypothetical protein